MQSCQQSATNAADACLCMGHYDMCLQGLGCSPTIVNAAVQQCQTQGCTVAQVRPARGRVPRLICTHYRVIDVYRVQCTTPGEELLRGCDPQPTRECAEQLFECATRGKGPLAQCPCRGPYLNCMKAAGCKSNVIQQLVQACEEIGCTPAQCHGRNNTDIATP